MAFNQNSLATAAELILGNCKIESALTVGATFVNLGNGAVTAAGHNIIPYDAQSQNGPRPLTGIADETFTVVGEMMEYEGSTLAAIHGGSVTETNTTTLSTIIGGGNTVITRRAFKITNTSMYGGSTVETIMIIPNAKMDNGINFNFKADNDTDPIAAMPFAITGINDTTASIGTQLFSITRTILE